MNEATFEVTLGMAMAALFQIGVSIGLHRWGVAMAVKHRGVWWRRMAWAPLLALALALVGMTLTTIVLFRTISAVDHGDPSMKATQLAMGISMAMNLTAVFALPAYLLYIGSTVMFFIGWLKVAD